MMKRKQEEVMILRKQLKPISGKYGKKKIMNQLKQDEGKKRCQFWCELKPLVIEITSVLANQTAIWPQVWAPYFVFFSS